MWTIILKFHQTTHASFIQSEGYQPNPEKMKNNGEEERQY